MRIKVAEIRKSEEATRNALVKQSEEQIQELNTEINYGKQRENKLMFFLYILKEKGYPVSQVFQDEIREIPTTRFSKNFDDEYKPLHQQFLHEKRLKEKISKPSNDEFSAVNRDHLTFNDRNTLSDRVYKRWNSWDSMDSNYAPLVTVKRIDPVKPAQVPQLDLSQLKQPRNQIGQLTLSS